MPPSLANCYFPSFLNPCLAKTSPSEEDMAGLQSYNCLHLDVSLEFDTAAEGTD